VDESLEAWLGPYFTNKKWWLTTAESCTGGLIGHRITNVPGSSGYYERGFITYSNEAKMELLGVPEEIFISHGAVSDPVPVPWPRVRDGRLGRMWVSR